MDQDFSNADVIFRRLNRRATGGTDVISLAAPALSTQFVKSHKPMKAQANQDGAFAEIIFPSEYDIDRRLEKLHGSRLQFGYVSTRAAAAYPAGYGERAARALAREDNVYQLKGTFPSAVLALAKLRARLEARQGDVDALNRIFARQWGLSESQVLDLPWLHVEGSEATRMAAMEDRAYHALSGHPGHIGGFRVDTATIAPDSLGSDTPLNWPRSRACLKTIAMLQNQGDLEITELRRQLPYTEALRFTMGWTVKSQPVYTRPFAWEGLIDRLMEQKPTLSEEEGMLPRDHDVGHHIRQTFTDAYITNLNDSESLRIRASVLQLASMVTQESNRALAKTIQVIESTEKERALIEEEVGGDFDEMDDAELSMKFQVPKYRVTRSTMRVGTEVERLGGDGLPDMRSHGAGKLRVKMGELREAGINKPMNVAGALNMAIYILINKRSTAMHAYTLMNLVKDPGPKGKGSVASRLRNSKFYEDQNIRDVGRHLFGDEFMNIFETVVRNIALMAPRTDNGIRDELWTYLSGRTGKFRPCPINGGWRDLIAELINLPEGWTLFYWARISIGKLHSTLGNSILAPIAAGEAIDFMSLMRRSVKEHAARWSQWYTAEYNLLLKKTNDEREATKLRLQARRDAVEDPIVGYAKYVPPHLRQETHLDLVYDEQKILNRTTGLGQETYKRMVMMQAKAKVFSRIEAISLDRELVVGISDEGMRQILIEFYQGRWYSLDRRIQFHKERGTTFMLGPLKLPQHPWGELITEFPSTLAGVSTLVRSLDNRVWTVPPEYMWEKLKTSISELWGDMTREINEITTYIEETRHNEDDEQALMELEARAGMSRDSMAGVKPFVIPVPGYRQYSSLPERTAEITKHGQKDVVEYTSASFTGVQDADEGDEEEDYGEIETEEPGEDDMDVFSMATDKVMLLSRSDVLPVIENKYLSYNEIWDELGMEKVSDAKKRIAFGVAFDTNLDDPHLDPSYGPLVTFEERPRIQRYWAARVLGMNFRLGHAVDVAIEDDM